MTVQMLKAHDLGTGLFDSVRVKTDQANLVPWLPKKGTYQTVGAAGTGNVLPTGLYYEYGDRQYPGGILVITGAHADTNYAQLDSGLAVPIAGRRIGIQIWLNQPSTIPQWDAFIDGRCVLSADGLSRGVKYDEVGNVDLGPSSNPTYWPLADDLPSDGPHNVEILVRTPASGQANIAILAFMVEERMGYRQGQAADITSIPTTLTTSFAQMPVTSYTFSSYLSQPRGVVGWTYVNTDTIAHNILTQFSINGNGPYTFKSLNVPAAASGIPGTAFLQAGGGSRPVAVDTTWQHKLAEAIGSGAVTCHAEMAL